MNLSSCILPLWYIDWNIRSLHWNSEQMNTYDDDIDDEDDKQEGWLHSGTREYDDDERRRNGFRGVVNKLRNCG